MTPFIEIDTREAREKREADGEPYGSVPEYSFYSRTDASYSSEHYERVHVNIFLDPVCKEDEESGLELVCINFDRHTWAAFKAYVDSTFEGNDPSRAVMDTELRRKLDMPIDDLDIPVRAHSCLESAKISTVGDLVKMSESALRKIRGFGKTSLREVKRKLADIGLSLGSAGRN